MTATLARTSIVLKDSQIPWLKESCEGAVQSGNSVAYVCSGSTSNLPAGDFWPAEDCHQNYFDNNGVGTSCHTRVCRFPPD